jgi:hypothetical protein
MKVENAIETIRGRRDHSSVRIVGAGKLENWFASLDHLRGCE